MKVKALIVIPKMDKDALCVVEEVNTYYLQNLLRNIWKEENLSVCLSKEGEIIESTVGSE